MDRVPAVRGVLVLLPLALLAACTDRKPDAATEPAAAPAAAVASGTAASADAGWTGRTHPDDVIQARQKIMADLESLMKPIDSMQLGPVGNRVLVQQSAGTIGTLLRAVPHLFPPTTNLYDPKNPTPPTIALPAVWRNFTTFYRQSVASVNAADALATMQGDDAELRKGGAALRASCDSCHALFLRRYVPAKVEASDAEFDFESALPQ